MLPEAPKSNQAMVRSKWVLMEIWLEKPAEDMENLI